MTDPLPDVSDAPGRQVEVGHLPTYLFGHASLTWWGIGGLMIIESTVFALTVLTYFYLRSHAEVWPLSTQPPHLIWGTASLLLMLVSALPNYLTKRAAEREDLKGTRLGMLACLLFVVALLLVRAAEFTALNVRWDSNAYGSVVWMLLALHTTHLLTDAFDIAVLVALFHKGPFEGKRFVDASENALYWYFVVLSWIPIYAVIYWGARL